MKKLGAAGHVTESNAANALGFLSWSLFNNDVGTYLSFLFFSGGIRKRDGLEVLMLEKGTAKGWGKGETTAITANFKSVSAVLAPAIMAQAYAAGAGSASGAQATFGGAPMFVCAVFTALSELVFRSTRSLG
eukprot:g2645.t1